MKLWGFEKPPSDWRGQVQPVDKPASDSSVPYPVIGGNIYFDKSTGTVTGCDWQVRKAVIPETIEDVPVIAIGDHAFQCETSCLRRVTIPNSVTSIGACAFHSCALIEVWIPDSVTSVGRAAFYCCNVLARIRIPRNVISVGENVLYMCTELTDVYYGGTRTQFEEELFLGIGNSNVYFRKAKVHYNANNPNMTFEDDTELQGNFSFIMPANKLLNLINWLRDQGFADNKIVECLESVEGKKKIVAVEE